MIIYLFFSFIISALTGIILLKKANNNNRFNSLISHSITSAFNAPRLIIESNNNLQVKFDWGYTESIREQSTKVTFFPDTDESNEEFFNMMKCYDESKKKCRYTSVSQRMTVVTLH